MSRRARCASIAEMTAEDREALATNVRMLLHEDEFQTGEAVLGMTMILADVGLSMDDLARLVFDEKAEARRTA